MWDTRDYSTLHLDLDVIEHEGLFNITSVKVKEQLVVRKDVDVIEHEGLFNITLRHKLK